MPADRAKPERGEGEEVGIWRKVSTAMYFDEKYLALTPVQPSGRSLWHHLIHGPHLGPIPGLSRIGRAAMAEELGWTAKAFDQAFQEVSSLGMAQADWDARVIWLPNALRHNLPASPNVVIGWKKQWVAIPDCSLKAEAYLTLKEQLYAWRAPFGEAFGKACPKPFAKALPKASPRPSPNQRAESREQLSSQVGEGLNRGTLSGKVEVGSTVGGRAPRDEHGRDGGDPT